MYSVLEHSSPLWIFIKTASVNNVAAKRLYYSQTSDNNAHLTTLNYFKLLLCQDTSLDVSGGNRSQTNSVFICFENSFYLLL